MSVDTGTMAMVWFFWRRTKTHRREKAVVFCSDARQGLMNRVKPCCPRRGRTAATVTVVVVGWEKS